MFSKTLTAVLTLSMFAFAAGPFVLNTPYVFGILVPEPLLTILFRLYSLDRILDGRTGEDIKQFAGLSGQPESFTWSTNIAAGTEVTLSILDEERDTAETAPFIIRHGRKCPSTPAYEGSCTHWDWDAALSGNNCTVVE
ncbi:hypothetical protein TRAPUB_4672 [Trametes pubescens]|uniref:Uncharacterized protein n=1 Tax=Trametes pubescens TaxID=154538 RepID=A0A1M2VAQ1_TRAPU|nr:hypothetical protein TRAPUB_4672 [Trametes pubescens]